MSGLQDGDEAPGAPERIEAAASIAIPFTLTEMNNISVEAIFNGVDRVRLMLHTATDAVFMTRNAVAKTTSMSFDETARITSWGGGSDVRFSRANDLRIGELTWSDVSVTEAEHSGRGTDGKFGLNLFGDRIVELDFDQSTLRIHSELPAQAEKFDKLAIMKGRDGLFVKGSIRIGTEWIEHDFLIHTGFGGTFLFDDEFAGAHALDTALESVDGRELTDSLGNIIKTRRITVPSFKLGRTEISSVPAELFAGKIGGSRTSIVGGDIWKRFHLILDSGAGFLYLRPNELFDTEYS